MPGGGRAIKSSAPEAIRSIFKAGLIASPRTAIGRSRPRVTRGWPINAANKLLAASRPSIIIPGRLPPVIACNFSNTGVSPSSHR